MRVTYYSVHKWLKHRHDPRRWFNKPRTNEFLAYLLGATLSDGCCYANRSRNCDRSIILSVKDRDFARTFASAAKKVFGKSDGYRVRVTQNRYVIKVNSVLLYDLVSKGVDSIRPIIDKFPGSFIRGFFDGDGDATTSISKGKLLFCVRATNTNIEYLRVLDELLRQFFCIYGNIHAAHSGGYRGMFEKRRVIFRDPVYVLKIDGLDQLSRFAMSIGFEIARKQKKLEDAIELVRKYGSAVAAEQWLRLYEKKNGRWKQKIRGPGKPVT